MWASFPSERIHRTPTGSDLTWHLKAIVIMGTFVSIYISLWSVQATAQISQIFLGVHYHDYFNKYMLYGCRLQIPLTHKIPFISISGIGSCSAAFCYGHSPSQLSTQLEESIFHLPFRPGYRNNACWW